MTRILERFETGRDCILVEEDEEVAQQADDDTNAEGEEDVPQMNDAVSDRDAEEPLTADAEEDTIVDNYIGGVTTNTSMSTRSQGWDDLVQVAGPAESPEPEDAIDVEPSATEGHDPVPPSSQVNFRTVSPSSLQNVAVPVARQCRGRPKGTDKSLNVKYGLSQSQRKRPSKCVTLQKPRLAHKRITTQSAHASAADNCAECGLTEPRKKAKGANMVNWIQCDKCQFWYHEGCVAALPCSYEDEYICA